MAEDLPPPPVRLMNFISEEQLDEAKKTRGEKVEDGTAQRDRPLYEILKENKDKQDAEFNERFKHRPPKSLDEDETEFLDKVEMSRREYEQQVADAEAQELRRFQLAVAEQSLKVHKIKEAPPVSEPEERNASFGKKNPAARPPLGMNIKVIPQAKKAKVSPVVQETSEGHDLEGRRAPCPEKSVNNDAGKPQITCNYGVDKNPCCSVMSSLVSYSDESDDEE